jgi:DNA-binding NtrC family response regulator
MKVLSFGYRKPLLAARHKLLKQARLDVVSVSSKTQALRVLEQKSFDVVVIGHHVPAEVRDLVARRAKTRLKAGVIFLYQHSIDHAEVADAVLSVDGTPKTLIAAICIVANGRKVCLSSE